MKRFLGMLMVVFGFISAAWAEADVGLEHMRAQMQMERGREEELQLLKLDVDRLKLELEKKKALSELGRVPGMEPAQAADSAPSVTLQYVLIAGGRKEALFDVDGQPVRAQEGSEVAGRTLKVIASAGVTLLGKDGRDSFLGVRK